MQWGGDGPAEDCTDDRKHHDVGWCGQGLPICCGGLKCRNAFDYGLLVDKAVLLTLTCTWHSMGRTGQDCGMSCIALHTL